MRMRYKSLSQSIRTMDFPNTNAGYSSVFTDINNKLIRFLLFLQSVLIEASKRNELMANKSTVSNSWFELLNTEVSSSLAFHSLFLFKPTFTCLIMQKIREGFSTRTHAMP